AVSKSGSSSSGGTSTTVFRVPGPTPPPPPPRVAAGFAVGAGADGRLGTTGFTRGGSGAAAFPPAGRPNGFSVGTPFFGGGGGGWGVGVGAGGAAAFPPFGALGASRSRKTRLEVLRFPDFERSSCPPAGGAVLGGATFAEEPRLPGSAPYIFRCSESISRKLA